MNIAVRSTVAALALAVVASAGAWLTVLRRPSPKAPDDPTEGVTTPIANFPDAGENPASPSAVDPTDAPAPGAGEPLEARLGAASTHAEPPEEPRARPRITLSGKVPADATLEEIISLLVLPGLQPNRRAIKALAAQTQRELVESQLLSRLADGTSPLDRAILEAFAAMKSKVALARIETLTGSPDPETRHSALVAIAQIGGDRGQNLLVDHLEEGPPDDRMRLLRVLATCPGPRVTAAVTRCLAENDAPLRRAAAQTLGRLGDPQTIPILEEYVEDSDKYVRRAVVQALGSVGGPQTADRTTEAVLQRAFTSDEDRHVRRAAAAALGKIGGPGSLEILQAALGDDDWLAGPIRTAVEKIQVRLARDER